VAYDPFRTAGSSLIGDPDAIQIPFVLTVKGRGALRIRTFEILIKTVNDAAMITDVGLYNELADQNEKPSPAGLAGYDALASYENRFLITSVSRGSLLIGGSILFGVGWAIKQLIAPGWEKSETKKHWDERVSRVIDQSAERLGHTIAGVAKKYTRFRVTDMSIDRDEAENNRLRITMEKHPQLEYKPHKKD
jgi:hypothetical protein